MTYQCHQRLASLSIGLGRFIGAFVAAKCASNVLQDTVLVYKPLMLLR